MLSVKSWGHHTLYECPESQPLCDHVQALYSFPLEEAHLNSKEYKSASEKSSVSELDLDVHKRFYKDMKRNSAFLELYRAFVKRVLVANFPDQHWMVVQKMPNIRFHMPGTVCVPPHRDTDEGVHRTAHPIGEFNFLLTLTAMFDTNAMYIESEPGLGDFQQVAMDAGQLLAFHGNQCVHGNRINVTDKTRVSLDFRCVLLPDFERYVAKGVIRTTRPNACRAPIALSLGGYYEIMALKPAIRQMQPAFGPEEANAVKDYVESGGFLTEYRHTRRLEKELARILKAKHVCMVSNGTLAITAALMALGVSAGDRVLVPSYTMVATANAVRLMAAEPVFVDVCAETLTLTPAIVRPYLTTCKAVIHVSLNNRSKGLRELVEICREAGVHLVEDAAQSLGSERDGQALGTFGDVGTFSFSSPKIISMGQGGCVVTNDDAVAERLRQFKDFGRAESGTERYESFGVNLKFTDLQAVVGFEQLKKLPARVNAMRRLWQTYSEGL